MLLTRVSPRALVAALLITGLAPAALAAQEPAGPDRTGPRTELDLAAGTISPELRATVTDADPDERIEALVVMSQDAALRPVAGHRAKVVGRLKSAAATSQRPVVEALESGRGQVVNEFWLKNMVLVEATPATLAEVAAVDGVDRVIPNLEVELPEGESAEVAAEPAAAGQTWGLDRIGAGRVQDELGITGKGVRVAVLDTGVDADHPDLAGALVTDDPADPTHPGGWIEFDESGAPVASDPHDSDTHGTHVSGTVLGADASGTRIGVAPDAELMAGLVIPSGSGTLAQVLAGMQWAIEPFDASGRPAGRPADVVSMSLGSEGHASEFIDVTRNMYLAGIFPSFAIGNECFVGASSSPANVYEAIAVGATDADENVAAFSCGEDVATEDAWPNAPASWPRKYVVPDVSAPGVDVYSSLPNGQWGSISGTSMATPHVSGAIALMLQARPDLTVDEALGTLAGTAFFDDRYGPRPNSRYGWGRIDAYAAVSEVLLESGVEGLVLDSKTREPAAGITVSRTDVDRSVTTGPDGTFRMRLVPGSHRLELSGWGYQTTEVTAEVAADAMTTIEQRLPRARTGSIHGRVTYGPTGGAVPGATVRLLDVPVDLHGTTSRTGRFTISDVPLGTYDVVAAAPGISRSAPASVALTASRSGEVDLELPEVHPTWRVSSTTTGRQVDSDAMWPSVSQDGRFVAFSSPASTLVAGDANSTFDIFVTDRRTGVIERVSVSDTGEGGDDFSLSPAITPDGRFVGFNSAATNLVPGDSNGFGDAFVHDRQTGKTVRVSVGVDGAEPNGPSFAPELSADGRFAVFDSDASNLVAGDDNGTGDVFVHDLQTGETLLVSARPDGSPADAYSAESTISDDGRYVAFHSSSDGLTEGDSDGLTDVFVRDLQTGGTKRVDGIRPGENREPVISGDGATVAFRNSSAPTWLAQTYVHDLETGETQALVDRDREGNLLDGYIEAPSLSTDGRTVAFQSNATNLVEGDLQSWGYDVFVKDLDTGELSLVSGAPGGAFGNDWSVLPAISGDGRFVAFQSEADNLVADDTNHFSDVFVHDTSDAPRSVFALSGLTASPTTVRPGGRIQVSLDVTNVGEVAGTYDGLLTVDGRAAATTTVEVGAGATRRAVVTVTLDPPGTHTLAVGPLEKEVTVRPR
jgi:subtilisin family serine protease/Tol biopolymer transport system component